MGAWDTGSFDNDTALGYPGDDDLEELADWLQTHPEIISYRDLALAAVKRVFSPQSELAELWEDSGEEWQQVVHNLQQRLSQGRAPEATSAE